MKTSRLFPTASILLALLLLPALAGAQDEEERKLELFAEGGPSFYTSVSSQFVTLFAGAFNAGSSVGTTGRLFTGARFYLNPKEALEASYAYSPNRLQNTVEPRAPFPGFFSSTSMRVHQGQFNYVRYVPWGRRGPLEPFVTAGLGFVTYAVPGNLSTKFAGNFGGGVDVRLHPRWRLRTEFRDVLAERPARLSQPGTTHNLVPSVGVAFRF